MREYNTLSGEKTKDTLTHDERRELEGKIKN